MMPTLATLAITRRRWIPPLLLPLFPFWPLVPAGLAFARVLERSQPEDAAKLRTVIRAFRELRGLTIDVETADHLPLRLRLL